jgi:hypothetical protein
MLAPDRPTLDREAGMPAPRGDEQTRRPRAFRGRSSCACLVHMATVEVSRRMAADPSVYALIADVTRMDQWSPEAAGARWTRGEPGTVGARFRGRNRNGLLRWSTDCTVTAVEPRALVRVRGDLARDAYLVLGVPGDASGRRVRGAGAHHRPPVKAVEDYHPARHRRRSPSRTQPAHHAGDPRVPRPSHEEFAWLTNPSSRRADRAHTVVKWGEDG